MAWQLRFYSRHVSAGVLRYVGIHSCGRRPGQKPRRGAVLDLAPTGFESVSGRDAWSMVSRTPVTSAFFGSGRIIECRRDCPSAAPDGNTMATLRRGRRYRGAAARCDVATVAPAARGRLIADASLQAHRCGPRAPACRASRAGRAAAIRASASPGRSLRIVGVQGRSFVAK